MIETKNMVPLAYSRSREYQVFLKLLDLLINASKSEVDNFVDLINPDKCPDHMLPLLASYVNYDYDYRESYEANRLIIKHYNELIRNRGSDIGISLAVSLAITATGNFSDIDLLSLFRVDYDEDKGKINTYVYYPEYISKMKDLIEVVRPAGVRYEIIPAEYINTVEKINVHDYVHYENQEDYLSSDRYKVDSLPNDKQHLDENGDPNYVDGVGFTEVAGMREHLADMESDLNNGEK